MLELCLLGTGAMMPMPDRRLAAMVARVNGHQLLIDCGEGTQVAMRYSRFSLAKIDAICITHFHADHIGGLPGLLLTMGTSGRVEPVRLIGPEGLAAVVGCLRVIAPELPFDLIYEEVAAQGAASDFYGAQLTCFPVEHIIPCLGYSLRLNRAGRFDKERAIRQNIPVRFWSALQSGQSVKIDGQIYTSDRVLGPERKGIKVVYCTDTRPSERIAREIENADLFICEGTYGDEAKREKANQFGHMTFAQAAELASSAGAKELLLTHFSPSMPDPAEYVGVARAIFPHTTIGEDNLHKTLFFDDL